MVSLGPHITKAFRGLRHFLLLDPQLLGPPSLLGHLPPGEEERKSMRACRGSFMGLEPGSCVYYFRPHPTGQNSTVWSHLFAREAGKCGRPTCQGRKWNGFTSTTWNFFVSLFSSVVRSPIRQNWIDSQVPPLISYMALGNLHIILSLILCLYIG